MSTLHAPGCRGGWKTGLGPQGREADFCVHQEEGRESPLPKSSLTPFANCVPSSELRILLLCGSDLLESFCIPGLWNEADVSSRVATPAARGWRGKGGRGRLILASGVPSLHSLPPQPEPPLF